MGDARREPGVEGESESSGGFWRRPGRWLYDRVIKPILTANDSPHSLALGFAMGFWVALTPTVGVQITIVVVLGTLMRANRIVAVAMTWISNPVTFIPMYYAYYRLGVWVMGRDALGYGDIKGLVSLGDGRSAWELIVDCFRTLGGPLWLGSAIVATLLAVPAYPLARGYFEGRSRRQAKSREDAAAADRPLGVGEAS